MKLDSKTVTRKHTNYASGIQALQLEASSVSDELHVPDQQASRTSELQTEHSRAVQTEGKIKKQYQKDVPQYCSLCLNTCMLKSLGCCLKQESSTAGLDLIVWPFFTLLKYILFLYFIFLFYF